jgi:hypothetical protein
MLGINYLYHKNKQKNHAKLLFTKKNSKIPGNSAEFPGVTGYSYSRGDLMKWGETAGFWCLLDEILEISCYFARISWNFADICLIQLLCIAREPNKTTQKHWFY